MKRRSGTLLSCVAAGLVVALLAGAPIARTALTVLLVFVAPGYALTQALFPFRTFSVAERAVLTIGLSLATTIVGGLVLNVTPWGLQIGSWLVLLMGVTAIVGAVAIVQRRRVGKVLVRFPHIGINWQQGALLAGAVLIAVTAVGVASVGAAQQHYAGFTQLYMLRVEAHGRGAANLRIVNHENETVQYSMVLRIDGHITRRWTTISMVAGGVWATVIPLPAGRSSWNIARAILWRQHDATKQSWTTFLRNS